MRNSAKLGFVTCLTLVRFPLVLLFFALALIDSFRPAANLFAPAFFFLIASAVTDLFDGYFARKLQVETSFGAHADPLMDKFFYLSTLPLLVFLSAENGHIAHSAVLAGLTVLLLTRDQWVTFLRSIGSLHNIRGDANWSGKLRTAINFPMICAIYFYEASGFSWLKFEILLALEGIAVAANMISIFVYTRKYWQALKKSMSCPFCEDNADEPSEIEKELEKEGAIQARKMESLGVMAGGIAHDFNNLLSVIVGNAGRVLKNVPEDSLVAESIREIEESASQGINLGNEVLAYAGRSKMSPVRVDISELISNMQNLIHAASDGSANIHYSLERGLPAINADPSRIEQVVTNLVHNAAEALAQRESGEIKISTARMHCTKDFFASCCPRRGLREGDYVYIEVADTGNGIPRAIRSKIFDPFFSTKIRGHGMGLAVALGIVRAHKGTIEIQSEQGKGSTFRVFLPIT